MRQKCLAPLSADYIMSVFSHLPAFLLGHLHAQPAQAGSELKSGCKRIEIPQWKEQDPLAAAAAIAPALATPESLRRELALARAISLAAKYGSGTTGAADRPADVLQLLLANSACSLALHGCTKALHCRLNSYALKEHAFTGFLSCTHTKPTSCAMERTICLATRKR